VFLRRSYILELYKMLDAVVLYVAVCTLCTFICALPIVIVLLC